MTNATNQPTFDYTLSGCSETTDGNHIMDWIDVPAQIWNAGSRDEVIAYGGHKRGMCFACDTIMIK